ncbi:MAG: NAD(P)-dependent oxidoreductase [Terracidiphilus sp.]
MPFAAQRSEQKMAHKVAILGLGTMGMGIARNLLKAGFHVVAYNRTRAKAEPLAAEGARIADTPADAAREADVIVCMLSDDDASRAAWTGENGALEAARAGSVLVECSTLTPAWILELAGLAAERDLRLLDAPVTGSRVQAETAQLTFLVGGDAAALDQARPVLAAAGKEIVHLGPVGSGARMKLINNFLCGVQVASLAEGMAWIERSGLDRDQALKVLKSGAPGSPLVGAISARMVEATYGVQFLLSLMSKDLHYAGLDAATLGLELSMAKTAEVRFIEAAKAGYAGMDMSAVVEPLRR